METGGRGLCRKRPGFGAARKSAGAKGLGNGKCFEKRRRNRYKQKEGT